MTSTIYYLHFDTGVFSDKASDSPSCMPIEFFTYENVAILAKSMHFLFPKIIFAILYDCVFIVDQPCVMVLVRSTKMHNFANINVQNLEHLVKLAIASFVEMELTIEGTIIDHALNTMLNVQREFSNCLLPGWQNDFFDTVFNLNVSLYRSCVEENLLTTVSHVVLGLFWQYQAPELASFLEKHPNIVGVSFTSHLNAFSAQIQRDERKINTYMVDSLLSMPQLKYLHLDNEFIGRVATMQLDLPNIVSLILYYREEDQVIRLCQNLDRFPSLCYLTIKQSGATFVISASLLSKPLQDALLNNYTLRQVDLPLDCLDSVNYYLERNAELDWRNVHRRLLNFCIALNSLDLPPYVLLEIFDWLPMERNIGAYQNNSLMHKSCHVKKIHLIMAVRDSINKLTSL